MSDVKTKSVGGSVPHIKATPATQPSEKAPEKIQDGALVDPWKKNECSSVHHDGLLARWARMLSGRSNPPCVSSSASQPSKKIPAVEDVEGGALVDPFKKAF